MTITASIFTVLAPGEWVSIVLPLFIALVAGVFGSGLINLGNPTAKYKYHLWAIQWALLVLVGFFLVTALTGKAEREAEAKRNTEPELPDARGLRNLHCRLLVASIDRALATLEEEIKIAQQSENPDDSAKERTRARLTDTQDRITFWMNHLRIHSEHCSQYMAGEKHVKKLKDIEYLCHDLHTDLIDAFDDLRVKESVDVKDIQRLRQQLEKISEDFVGK